MFLITQFYTPSNSNHILDVETVCRFKTDASLTGDEWRTVLGCDSNDAVEVIDLDAVEVKSVVIKQVEQFELIDAT